MTHIDFAEDSALIERALDRVLGSPEFANASRLKEFLTYIVTESCNGRRKQILGKTIAQDVYARGVDADGKGISLVKVDAGRLRRRLEEYYAGTGINDRVHISIHRGGYAPSFEGRELKDLRPENPVNVSSSAIPARFGLFGTLTGLVAIGMVILVAAFWWKQEQLTTNGVSDTDARAFAERQAILAKSPSALQAVNIAEQARTLIFPPTDPMRLQVTLDMFKRSIELDAEYFGGYAGTAQVLGLQALFSPPGSAGETILALARQQAERAVKLRPEAAWSQSAFAWVLFVSREFDQANEISMRAVAIDPEDFNVLDFDGLIALFSGDFERSLQSVDPDRHQGRAGSRFVFRNIYAVANFHVGKYDDTIRFINESTAKGDPVSQISVVYLAAAYLKTGNRKRAEDLVKDFENTWPDSRIDLIFNRAFNDQRYADEVIGTFKSAGWSPS